MKGCLCMNLEETALSSQSVFEGRLVQVRVDKVLLPDGRESSREVVIHRFGGACVLAEDAQGRVAFVRQFRYAYGQELLELPAGKLEPGEPPVQCAARELEEETGLQAKSLTSLGQMYPSVGYLNETIHLFAATGLTHGSQHLDQGEFLQLEWLPLKEALNMVRQGQLPDGKTQLALLKYAAFKATI